MKKKVEQSRVSHVLYTYWGPIGVNQTKCRFISRIVNYGIDELESIKDKSMKSELKL